MSDSFVKFLEVMAARREGAADYLQETGQLGPRVLREEARLLTGLIRLVEEAKAQPKGEKAFTFADTVFIVTFDVEGGKYVELKLDLSNRSVSFRVLPKSGEVRPQEVPGGIVRNATRLNTIFIDPKIGIVLTIAGEKQSYVSFVLRTGEIYCCEI